VPDFSLQGYRNLIAAFRERGYSFSLFEEVEQRLASAEAFVLLRHDIDISLQAALEIARIEHEEGVRASYFVLLRSPFYNLLSSDQAELIEEIHAYGHELALHVDLTDHHGQPTDVEREIETLLSFYPYANSRLASVHSPHTLESLPIERYEQLHNVYHRARRGDIAYISDSTGRWRYGYPLDSAAFHEGKPIQLLTHPIWWVAEGETPARKLERWFQQRPQQDLERLRTFLPKLFRLDHS
jgi:hypothetical protein